MSYVPYHMYVQIKVEPFCPSINYYYLDESRSGFDFGRVHDALIKVGASLRDILVNI
jgi:hypothetical protein